MVIFFLRKDVQHDIAAAGCFQRRTHRRQRQMRCVAILRQVGKTQALEARRSEAI